MKLRNKIIMSTTNQNMNIYNVNQNVGKKIRLCETCKMF